MHDFALPWSRRNRWGSVLLYWHNPHKLCDLVSTVVIVVIVECVVLCCVVLCCVVWRNVTWMTGNYRVEYFNHLTWFMRPVIVHEHFGHLSLARTVSNIKVLGFCVSLLCASSTGACCEFMCTSQNTGDDNFWVMAEWWLGHEVHEVCFHRSSTITAGRIGPEQGTSLATRFCFCFCFFVRRGTLRVKADGHEYFPDHWAIGQNFGQECDKPPILVCFCRLSPYIYREPVTSPRPPGNNNVVITLNLNEYKFIPRSRLST